MKIAAALLALVCASSTASARPADGAQEVMVPAFAVLGAIGVLTTGIAAIVYAERGESFDTGWIIAALFSGALSVGTGIHLMVADTSIGPAAPPFGVALAAASAWPLGYTVRSALSPGEPGTPFAAAGATIIPILALEL